MTKISPRPLGYLRIALGFYFENLVHTVYKKGDVFMVRARYFAGAALILAIVCLNLLASSFNTEVTVNSNICTPYGSIIKAITE